MKRHSQAYDYTMILIGSALFAASINLFVVPVNLYNGGIVGLSQIFRTVLVSRMNLNFSFDIACQRIINLTYKFCCIRNWHIGNFTDIFAIDQATADFGIQSGSVAVRTGKCVNDTIQFLFVKLTFLGSDDTAVHTWINTFIFRSFWPVGRWIFKTDLWRIEKQIHLFF